MIKYTKSLQKVFMAVTLLIAFATCSKKDIATLGAQPSASFSITPLDAPPYNTYLLKNTTQGAFSYIWTNYDGESQSGTKTTGVDTLRVYYSDSGSYRVNLLANTSGGYDSTSKIISVTKDDPTIYAQGFTGSQLWLTDPDNNSLFFNKKLKWKYANASLPIIYIDPTTSYQSIDGFGFTLTGGSAQLISKMSSMMQDSLLKEIFDTTGVNIGISYLRISIGASDLNDHVFSYDDLADGMTDPNLSSFNLGPDTITVIPILHKILKLNPKIKILASPWSAPAWMKDNNSAKGGNLLSKYYSVYAQYFIKYLQKMQEQGIYIDAITPQNEPLNADNNPSMFMQDTVQAAFVKVLGIAIKSAGLATKIIIWDHNADRPDYPIYILNDPNAAPFVDGSAFHLYAGDISALNTVHNAFPNKNLYFTEQYVGSPSNLKGDLGWHMRNIVIGAPRNWSKNVLEWNLASDPDLKPHTDGGCSNCLGAITVDGNNYTRNTSYYIIAHASKFVRPGSVRIASNYIDVLPNIAFKNPNGQVILLVLNNQDNAQAFNIQMNEQTYQYTLNGGAVATFVL